MKKVNHIGYAYHHRFKMDDGSLLEVETTSEDYRQLGGRNPNKPTIPGGRWLLSYERLKFDTPTTHLRDGEYADVEGRYKYVKLENLRECSVKMRDVSSDGEITLSGRKRVEENNNSIER